MLHTLQELQIQPRHGRQQRPPPLHTAEPPPRVPAGGAARPSARLAQVLLQGGSELRIHPALGHPADVAEQGVKDVG